MIVVQSEDMERLRLDALAALEVFDTPPEPAFDDLTKLACSVFKVPIALVSLIDTDRQWFKSCIGLDVDSTARDLAFCDIAIRTDEVMVVKDATRDSRFADNALVTGAPHIRFYAGAPLRYQGALIGTLCIIDRQPRPEFTIEQAGVLEQMALSVSSALAMRKDVLVNTALLKRREESEKTLALMEEVGGVGHWTFTPATGVVTWTDQVFRIHGFPVGPDAPDYPSVLAQYSPADAQKLAMLVERAVTTGEGYELEGHITRPDGAVRSIVAKARCITAPDGRVETILGVLQDVTDYRSIISDLEVSEARYRLLADHSHDMISLFSLDGTFEYMSPSIRTIMGYDPEEMVGRNVRTFLLPEDIPQTETAIRDYILGNDYDKPIRLQWRATCKDGSLIWVELHAMPILESESGKIVRFQGVARDISFRKAAEARLAEASEQIALSEARYKLLAENVPGMVAYWDRSLQCGFVNNAYLEWLDCSLEEVLGRSKQAILGVDAVALSEPHIQGVLAGRKQVFERAVQRPSGAVGYVLAHFVPDFADDGKVRGFYALETDITNLKLKELALADSNSQLVEARRQAEAASEVKSQFLATMSHEIRTPLTTILGYANLLGESDGLSMEATAFTKRISKAGRTLLGLVTDVLDVSRLEVGQVTLNPKATNIRDLVGEVVDQFQMTASQRGLALTADYDSELSNWAMADDTRLMQVLSNLVGNACKFTDKGRVLVKTSAVHRDGASFIRFEIEDTGPGLKADQISKLFARFQQLDSSINRKHGGSGLGLAICKELVKLMRGQIGVEAIEGVGSTFWFEIPLSEAGPAATNSNYGYKVSHNKRDQVVLLVDDHAINRQLIKALILPYAGTVVEAADGAEAIELCRTQRFNLVFMDIQMPEVDGVTATRAIRTTCPLNTETPIVALTALATSGLPSDFSRDLFADVLNKPIDPQKFLDVLNRSTSALSPVQ